MFTQDEVDRLTRAIARGVRTVQYADRSVTYHSLDEMLRLLATMSRSASSTTTSGTRYAAHSKGV